ncbi:MAG: TolC family protein [Bacteroidota bacterium]
MKEAFDLAKKNNPFYNAEKYNTDLSKADIASAKLQINPSFGASYIQVVSPKYYAENTGTFNSANRQLGFQLGKSFQVHGQRKYKIQEAEHDLMLTQANLNEYERNLLSDVADKWLEIWYENQKLQILKLAKENSDSLIKINQVRLKNEVITKTEFSRTEILDDQYRLMLINAQQDYKSSMNDLLFMLGINDSIIVNDNEAYFYLPIINQYDSVLQYALNKRTDIQVNNSMKERAKVDIQLQKALAYPQPEIGFNYSSQNQVPYLGTYLNITLPTFNRNQAEIAKSEITLKQSESLLNANINKVKNEVKTAWNEYVTYRSSYEKYKDIFQKSEKVLQSVKLSYLKGGTTILDYLEAERNWFDLQNQYNEAFYNYKKAYLQILFVSNYIQNI